VNAQRRQARVALHSRNDRLDVGKSLAVADQVEVGRFGFVVHGSSGTEWSQHKHSAERGGDAPHVFLVYRAETLLKPVFADGDDLLALDERRLPPKPFSRDGISSTWESTGRPLVLTVTTMVFG
jgi:hypothetical protein